jgi:hypothetical protein
VIVPKPPSRLAERHGTACTAIRRPPSVSRRIAVGPWFAAAMTAIGLVLASTPPVHADPIDIPIAPNPYPKDSIVLTTYTRLAPADYFIPGLYGVYFLSPGGLNCGIWLRGSFGCAGPLPGAPPGADHIGWFNGDTNVHNDWAIAVGFPRAQAQQVLPPRSYLNWNETTCATTADNSTYCYRGMFRFLITPNGTYLNG